MKQLFIMNDTVKHAKAIPRTLYLVASTSSACRSSENNQDGMLQRGWSAHIRRIRQD